MKTLLNRALGILATRGPLVYSTLVTGFALFVYYTTFIGSRATPLIEFVDRMELASLDLRFQLRGPVRPDPRIVIVDVDQQAQEVLGRWPFPRSHFATLLDKLREDGARVVAFDITFSQPDRAILPIETLRKRLERAGGALRNPQLAGELNAVQKQFDHDARFAKAIEQFGRVVLGNFFLFTEADLSGMTKESLDRFANLVAYHPFPQTRALASAQGTESYVNIIRILEDREMVPSGAEANVEELTLALSGETAASGFFNIFPDSDGVVRHAQLALPFGRSADRAEWDFYASLDVQAVRLLLNLPNERVVLQYGREGIDSIDFGGLKSHPDFLGRVLVNYRGPARRTYPYYSMGDVVTGKFNKGTFKDKLVIVGASATGIGDLRNTPYASVDFPGVEIHANVIDNILNNQFLEHRANQVAVDIAFILLFGVPLGLALNRVQPRHMPWALALLIPFLGVVYFAFTKGWWLNVITPSLLTLVPNTVLVGLHRVLAVERERRRTRDAFQQYISPEVIRRLLKNPELVKPRKIEISIMFTDVRGFTSLAEDLDAQEVAHLLNQYLGEMTRVVFRNQGTLDKYMGDGMMAFWGAPFEDPDHAPKACRTAVGMLDKLAALQKEWQAEGKPLLDIGVGINTGMASVGNMGSQLRYGYTVVGDAVNLSSRLEGMNKVYGTRILVGEETRVRSRDPELLFREVDWIRVTGKKQHVTLYELVGSPNGNTDWPERIELFENGLRSYRQRDWSTACTSFEQVLERWPFDGPAQVFLTRCEEFAVSPPPPHWDGVYVAQQK